MTNTTKRAVPSTEDAEKAATNTTKGAATSTDTFNKTNTEKRPRTSQAELKAKRTNGKKTGAVPHAEIKTATDQHEEHEDVAGRHRHDGDGHEQRRHGAGHRHDEVRGHSRYPRRRPDPRHGDRSPLRVQGFPAPDGDKRHEALLLDFKIRVTWTRLKDTRAKTSRLPSAVA